MMNYKRNHKFIGLSFALALMSSLNCQAQLLPTPTQEAKPALDGGGWDLLWIKRI